MPVFNFSRFDCQVCVRANGKTSAHLKSVQNVHRVLEVERNLENVDATACLTALSMTTW